MSIKVNGTDIGSSIKLNNTDLSEIIFNGVSVWQALPQWDSRGLNYNSWNTIAEYIRAGKFAEKASVGDTKTFKCDGKTYTAEVVAINDGTGDASQWYPDKTADFICKELYEYSYRYNASTTNRGGFPSSELKNTLLNLIYPLFPNDLKNEIIEKSHSYQAGYWSSGTWYSSLVTTSSQLWLPTYYEIAGTTATYAKGETSSNNKAYVLTSKIKNLVGTSSPTNWWLGTPRTSGNTFWLVSTTGSLSDANATFNAGVPICFRIG